MRILRALKRGVTRFARAAVMIFADKSETSWRARLIYIAMQQIPLPN
jgi:hypothetical protein